MIYIIIFRCDQKDLSSRFLINEPILCTNFCINLFVFVEVKKIMDIMN